MHELVIGENVVAGVCERMGNVKVSRVVLEIGKLTAVLPDALRFCFDICAKGTSLEGATLEIHEIPGQGVCRTCKSQLELDASAALCDCGSADIELLNGEQLLIKAVEIA